MPGASSSTDNPRIKAKITKVEMEQNEKVDFEKDRNHTAFSIRLKCGSAMVVWKMHEMFKKKPSTKASSKNQDDQSTRRRKFG